MVGRLYFCMLALVYYDRAYSTVQHDLIGIDKLQFVSFTVNPDYDTPRVLKEYAKRYDADINTWSFVTGKYEQIQELIANGFKMGDEEEIVFIVLVLH